MLHVIVGTLMYLILRWLNYYKADALLAVCTFAMMKELTFDLTANVHNGLYEPIKDIVLSVIIPIILVLI